MNETVYSKQQQKATLLVSALTSFLTTFVGSALNLSIPDMAAEFNVSATAIGWVITAYMLTVSSLSVPFGKIADMTSRKTILVTGIGLFVLSCAASVFSVSIWMLIAIRIFQGIGAAMIFSTNAAILVAAFPGAERGRALGTSVSATYTGLAAGPVIGGVLNHYLGWRSILICTAVLGILAWLNAVKNLPAAASEGERGKHDALGNFLYAAMIVMTIYGLSAFSTVPYAGYLVPLGLLAGAWFVRTEMRAENPVIEVRLFAHNLAYTFSNLAALLNYGATFAITYLLSIYLQLVMGYTSQAAGLVLIVSPVIMAIFSPVAGRLSDRVSPYKLASFGMGLNAAGLLILAFISNSFPLWAIILSLVVNGFGFAFFSSPNINAVMACVDRSSYSVASSILATMRTTGQTLSMAVITTIVGMHMGTMALASASPEILITTMRSAFMVFIGICIVGVFISARRKDQAENRGEHTPG